jgi:hypothetical protein
VGAVVGCKSAAAAARWTTATRLTSPGFISLFFPLPFFAYCSVLCSLFGCFFCCFWYVFSASKIKQKPTQTKTLLQHIWSLALKLGHHQGVHAAIQQQHKWIIRIVDLCRKT